MNVKYYSFLLFFAFTINAFAQKQNVYFLKNSGRNISVRDSADLIRIISEPDSGTTLFNIKEYYKNGKVKLVGKTTESDSSILNGPCVEYYQTGKRKRIATYEKGRLEDNVYDYYPNGILYRIRNFKFKHTLKDYSIDGEQINFTVILAQDSSGKQTAKDSSGYYIDYYDDFKKIHEEGNLISGKKVGVWQGCGNEKDSILLFTEKYDNGKLIDGVSKDNSGNTYTYVIREVFPEFVGGERAFGWFLSHNIKFPKTIKWINTPVRVFTQFAIEKNGSLSNFKTLSSPNNEFAKEALRVLQNSPNWIAGLKFGKPIRVLYTVPISFSNAN